MTPFEKHYFARLAAAAQPPAPVQIAIGKTSTAVSVNLGGLDWGVITSAAAGDSYSTTGNSVFSFGREFTNPQYTNNRGLFTVDCAGISGIVSAKIYLLKTQDSNPIGGRLYRFEPTDWTNFQAYNDFTDVYAIESTNENGYFVFDLNPQAIADINAENGIIQFMVRNIDDVENTAPTSGFLQDSRAYFEGSYMEVQWT